MILSILCTLTVGCDNSPQHRAAKAAGEALEMLEADRLDDYVDHFSFSDNASADSTLRRLYAQSVSLYMNSLTDAERPIEHSITHVQLLRGDSLAMVFYTLYLAGGDSLHKEEVLRLIDGEWKLIVGLADNKVLSEQ